MFLILCRFDNRAFYQHLPFLDRDIRKHFRLLSYDALPYLKGVPAGPIIFTDFEGLPEAQIALASQIWRAARAAHPDLAILNHPIQSLRRYELLRTLFRNGVNSFDVHRLADAEASVRFPVFIRAEHTHDGILTPLLHNASDLNRAIASLTAEGHGRDDKIIVEFCDYGEAGRYCKYGAFRVGGAIIPAMAMFSDEWEVRNFDPQAAREAELGAQARYIADNPHQDELLRIFDMANIEFGRIDYAVVDGRIQVFEINTNPTWPPKDVRDAFMAALLALDDQRPRPMLRLGGGARKKILLSIHAQVFRGLEWLVYACGLSGHGGLLSGLYQAELISHRWLAQAANAKSGSPRVGEAQT